MQNKSPLYVYVIAVIIVWAVILGIMWFSGRAASFYAFSLVSSGFMLGMLAMYIAVHLYKWK
ncbi:MAG: hypothetical protein P4L61_01505 [Candidatus Pacebacteria bacterium]|jgi:hypothetical protein|nr:hypothetical protein [Candidatus Paceibacterota bacterium]